MLEEVTDLTYRPDLDPEAQALSALLWASADIACAVTAHLRAADFHRPVYARLFTVVARLVGAGQPHTAPLVLAELERAGRVHGQLSAALLDVTTADARGHDAPHLALAVMRASYRRGYAAAAVALEQIAAEAHTEDLYELMCQLGRDRREAAARLTAATEALG
ncbi:DNA helicase [Skermania sp. ID1734]|nr:DNA helicase [Skermania sp. ID1734]